MANKSGGADKPDLSGLRVASFESRRAKDIARLIESCGGQALCGPSMQEIPLGDESGVLSFGEQLFSGECDALVLLTGVGTRVLLDSLAAQRSAEQVLQQLQQVALLCRGPKPAALLKREGLTPALVAPEPNTWRELLASIDEHSDILSKNVAGKNVFVQEYGAPNQDLLEGLQARGAQVHRVPVYRWALPDDTAPLKSVVHSIVEGTVDCVLFTSAHQVTNVLKFSATLGVAAQFQRALSSQLLIASVGPVTTEALLRHDIKPHVVPEHPKMGPLVITLARNAKRLLAERLSTSGS